MSRKQGNRRIRNFLGDLVGVSCLIGIWVFTLFALPLFS
jgi:hypothetical protein